MGGSADELRAKLAEQEQAEVSAFSDALTALCKEHGCELYVIPSFTQDGRVTASISIRRVVSA